MEGRMWKLPKNLTAKGLTWGDYVMDVEVVHGLHSGALIYEDRPRVNVIRELRRADGGPLGDGRQAELDLQAIAVDAVVKMAEHFVQVGVPTKRGDGVVWLAPGGADERWREAARVVRLVASEFGGARWTTERDAWLMRAWNHIVEHRCATQQDLADEIGVPVQRVSDRLRVLRKRYPGQVPRGTPGRPRTRKDEQ